MPATPRHPAPSSHPAAPASATPPGPHPHPAPHPKAGVIELRLQTVNQLFNSMDPSPYPEKDIDADAEEFIVSWAKEHPRNAPLVLLVYLTNPPADRDPEALIQETMHAYFTHKADLTRRHFKQLVSRGRLSLLIGLIFLAACLLAADLLQGLGVGALIQVVRESLIIGGWVAMWGPMEIFLYDWWPLLHERRVYERLSHVTVRVVLRES